MKSKSENQNELLKSVVAKTATPKKKKKRRRKKVSKTENQRLFEAQVKRIQNRVRALEKRGYRVDRAWLEQQIKRPTRITKQRLEALKSVRPENIYAHSEYLTPTGVRLTGQQARDIERREAAKRGKITREKSKIEEMITAELWSEWQKTGQSVSYEEFVKSSPSLEKSLEGKYRSLFKEWQKAGARGSFSKFVENKQAQEQEQEQESATATAPSTETASGSDTVDISKLPRETDVVNENFMAGLATVLEQIKNPYAQKEFEEKILNWIDDLIATFGEDTVAAGLQAATKAGLRFEAFMAYDEHKEAFTEMQKQFLEYMDAPEDIQNDFDNIID